jgi:branched-chain amino acid transport system substrate-binding protein
MRKSLIIVLAVIALTAACGNSTTGSSDGSGGDKSGGGGGGSTPGTVSNADLQKNVPVDAPGVTDTEIHVGGVVSKTNPLGGEYDQAFKGVEAYFDYINEGGGIYGRKLKLTSKRDDQLVNNQAEIQALISQDNVFAVMPVANIATFSGAPLLTDAGIPTFGWNVNAEWTGPPNLFGEKGSYLCFTCARADLPWLAKQLNRTKIGVMAYGVQQSTECAKGIKASLEKYPTASVAFEDTNVAFNLNPDFSVQVAKMKTAGVDFVSTCMDDNGVTALAKEMKKQGLEAVQYLPNGYNYDLVNKFSDVFAGSIVLTGFAPFEIQNPPAALTEYLKRIEKVGGKKGELSLAGWLDADLFVKGLKAAGPEFSRQKVIDGINQMKDWDADGLIPGIDWTIGHTADPDELCFAFSKIESGKFVPQYGEPGKPFVCFDRNATALAEKPTIRA